MDSFPDEKHFASYVVLAPTLGTSAGKKFVKENGARTPRAWDERYACRHPRFIVPKTELGAFFRSVARRVDKKAAVKATARRMAHMIFRGVRYGKDYVDHGAEAYEARLRERTLKTVKKLIKSYNINSSELTVAFAAA